MKAIWRYLSAALLFSVGCYLLLKIEDPYDIIGFLMICIGVWLCEKHEEQKEGDLMSVTEWIIKGALFMLIVYIAGDIFDFLKLSALLKKPAFIFKLWLLLMFWLLNVYLKENRVYSKVNDTQSDEKDKPLRIKTWEDKD